MIDLDILKKAIREVCYENADTQRRIAVMERARALGLTLKRRQLDNWTSNSWVYWYWEKNGSPYDCKNNCAATIEDLSRIQISHYSNNYNEDTPSVEKLEDSLKFLKKPTKSLVLDIITPFAYDNATVYNPALTGV